MSDSTKLVCEVVKDDDEYKELADYEWDWGHYFGSFDQAAMYWLQEVGGMRVEEEAL